ncbi:MAG: glycosyl hydrolase 108 family protein [Nitrospiraceae bacterium]
MIDVIADILRREGGFVDDPDDGKGPTNHGINAESLCEYRREVGGFVPKTVDEIREAIRNLSAEEARAIYRRNYIDKPRFGEIKHPELRALVIDTGVLHGRHRAARWLQGVAKVKADGWVGDITLGAVNGRSWRPIYLGLLARRYAGFAAFVKSKPSQLKWLKGWVNRANEFLLRL